MRKIIPVENWRSRATLAHARALLGCYLVRDWRGEETARMITEVEIYEGAKDGACHARFGRTARSEVLYAAPGTWYVYLCYGVHELLNLITGPVDFPAAILIRGVEGIAGPGRVTKALHVGRGLNRTMAVPASGLYIEDRGVRVPNRLVKRTPRIGVDYAGPVWAGKLWRLTFDPKALPSRPAGPAQG